MQNIEKKSVENVGEYKYASFTRRFVASMVDSIILGIINLAIQSGMGFQLKEKSAIIYIVTLIVSMVFEIGFWIKRDGQTPGKRVMHIKVIKANGEKFDWFTGFIRYFGQFVSAFALCLGYLAIISDKKKQSWHDKLAGTYVVESDDKKPSKLVYGLGCFIPFIIFLAAFLVGFFTAFNSKIKEQTLTNTVTKRMNANIKQMNPEAKKHFDISQKYFTQIREASNKNDIATIKLIVPQLIKELKTATELDPTNPQIWVQLGHAYTWVGSEGADGGLEAGLNAYKKAEELDPSSWTYINFVGDMLYRLGRYEDSVLEYQKTLRLTKESGFAYLGIAKSYKMMKMNKSAKEHAEKALEIFTEENSNGSFDRDILQVRQLMEEL